MSEVRMRRVTVKACNVRKGDVVIRVGKKVREVKKTPKGEVRIKLYRQRKDVVLDADRLVRITRPVAARQPTHRQKLERRIKAAHEESRDRNLRIVEALVKKHYPKTGMGIPA